MTYVAGCPWWWCGELGCAAPGSAAVRAGQLAWDWFQCLLSADGSSDARATWTQHTEVRGQDLLQSTMNMSNGLFLKTVYSCIVKSSVNIKRSRWHLFNLTLCMMGSFKSGNKTNTNHDLTFILKPSYHVCFATFSDALVRCYLFRSSRKGNDHKQETAVINIITEILVFHLTMNQIRRLYRCLLNLKTWDPTWDPYGYRSTSYHDI